PFFKTSKIKQIGFNRETFVQKIYVKGQVKKMAKLEHVKQPDISLYINGEFVPSEAGATFENYNPFTNETVNLVQEGRKSDIEKAVAAARDAFDNGPWRTMKLSVSLAYIYIIAASSDIFKVGSMYKMK